MQCSRLWVYIQSGQLRRNSWPTDAARAAPTTTSAEHRLLSSGRSLVAHGVVLRAKLSYQRPHVRLPTGSRSSPIGGCSSPVASDRGELLRSRGVSGRRAAPYPDAANGYVDPPQEQGKGPR